MYLFLYLSFSNDSESILKDSESILCSSQIASARQKHKHHNARLICCRIHFYLTMDKLQPAPSNLKSTLWQHFGFCEDKERGH